MCRGRSVELVLRRGLRAHPVGLVDPAGHRQPLREPVATYLDDLGEAGYRLGLVGKWHLGANDVPRPHFVRWLAHDAGGGPYYGAPLHDEHGGVDAPGYVTDVFTEAAQQFIVDEAQRSEPIHLSVHYTAPHSPWANSHPVEHTDLYAGWPFDSVPQGPAHPWVPLVDGHPIGGEADTRAALVGYFAAVTAMDAGIGRILGTLEQVGLADSTIVIITSDNGFSCGQHGIWGKGNGTFPQNMYQETVTVPFLVRFPGQVPAGQVREELLSGYDLAPTLREACGMAEREDALAPGRSFWSLLRGEGGGGHDRVVVHDEYGPVRMIRTREWKYVHRYPHGPHELYHLTTDPGEQRNLADDPAHAEVRADLASRLATWFAEHSVPGRDGAALPVAGAGQHTLVRADSGLNAFAELHTGRRAARGGAG